MPVEEFRHRPEVNVIGQLAVTQAFTDVLRAGRGRIVNVGSLSGVLATPITGPYAASKFALEGIPTYCAASCVNTGSTSSWCSAVR